MELRADHQETHMEIYLQQELTNELGSQTLNPKPEQVYRYTFWKLIFFLKLWDEPTYRHTGNTLPLYD